MPPMKSRSMTSGCASFPHKRRRCHRCSSRALRPVCCPDQACGCWKCADMQNAVPHHEQQGWVRKDRLPEMPSSSEPVTEEHGPHCRRVSTMPAASGVRATTWSGRNSAGQLVPSCRANSRRACRTQQLAGSKTGLPSPFLSAPRRGRVAM